MRVLVLISILSFCALAWATLAIARHVRRPAAPSLPPAPQSASTGSSLPDPTLLPSPIRKLRPHASQRHDRTYAHQDSGNLQDPGARAQTRPGRTS